MTQHISLKPSLDALTEIGDIAFDPSTLSLKAMTTDGVVNVIAGSGVTASNTSFSHKPVMQDNRPTVADKRLAIQVSVDDFERLSHNDDGHLIRLIQNANDKLRQAIQADTRCADCRNLEVKVEEHQDLLRARSNHVLTTACRLRKPGITKVVCPDGRVSGSADASLYELEMPTYIPEVTPKANPDTPMGFDEAW